MKRVLFAIIMLQICMFVYFSYELSRVKEVVSTNGAIANQRAQANVTVWLQTQKQLDQIKDSLKIK